MDQITIAIEKTKHGSKVAESSEKELCKFTNSFKLKNYGSSEFYDGIDLYLEDNGKNMATHNHITGKETTFATINYNNNFTEATIKITNMVAFKALYNR